MDGFDGLQDLLAESQGGAHGEGSSGLTSPQVGQVTTLRGHEDDKRLVGIFSVPTKIFSIRLHMLGFDFNPGESNKKILLGF